MYSKTILTHPNDRLDDNYIIEPLEPNVLTPKRTEYGKKMRKAYENGDFKESRHNMTILEPRTDGISNTITTVQKMIYCMNLLIINIFVLEN